MSTTKPFDPADLRQFTGTEHWYRHALVRSILFTEGARYVADMAGAYWLLDEIALAQKFDPAIAADRFQVWTLAVTGSTATLTCQDGDDRVVLTKPIPFTDFPGDGVTLWCTGGVIMVPSEY